MEKTLTKKPKISYDVSVIIPIYNGEKWINSCFTSIKEQTSSNCLNVEICVCNDSSTDRTKCLLDEWQKIFHKNNINVHIFENNSDSPKGVGYGKNRAVDISTGTYLCFQDIDDVMLPDRILKQYETAKDMQDNVLLGSQFKREPPDSTIRYSRWANSLTQKELNEQIYTSNGPTIIMPTWFCHRNVYNRVGGFSEEGKGIPEDLIFFYKHLDNAGIIFRVDAILSTYRYHSEATTFSIQEQTIWNLRVQRLQNQVLTKWAQFTIWNAGKQGRKFYKSLTEENRNKVVAFCDVDVKKIGKFYEPFNEVTRTVGGKIDIVDFKNATPPFIICVKLDMTNGNFEENLNSLNLVECKDYVYFS